MAIGITINSVSRGHYLVLSSIQFSRQLGERGNGSFTLIVADGSGYAPVVGQDVGFWDGAIRVFGGSIESLSTRRLAPGAIEHSVSVSSQERHADKRIIESRSYLGWTAGDIVSDILSREMALEALPGTIDAGATIPNITFDHVTCAEAFDQLATLSNYVWWEDADGYVSFIARAASPSAYTLTGADVLYGASVRQDRSDYRNTQHLRVNWAAFADLSAVFFGDGGSTQFALALPPAELVTVTLHDAVYAHVKGTLTGVPQDGDTITINGVTYTFRSALTQTTPRQVFIGADAWACAEALWAAVAKTTYGYGTLYSTSTNQHPNCLCSRPHQAGPDVDIHAYFATSGTGNGVTVSESCSVFAWESGSMGGAETSGSSTAQSFGAVDSDAQWWWAAGDTRILQLYPSTPLTANSMLAITYRALGGDVITITDWDEVAARAAAEGGTGRYEHLAEDTSIVDASTGLAKCQALLDSYKHIPKTVDYDTLKHDLTPGEVIAVDMTDPDLSGNFLVNAIHGYYTPGFGHFRYRVTVIDQTRVATWLQFWESLGATSGTVSQSMSKVISETAQAYSSAPDVLNFQAGIRNADGSYTNQLRWDETLSEFLLDLYCEKPGALSFGGVQFYLRVPNALVAGGYEYDPVGTPFGSEAFKPAGEANALSVTASIAWESTPTAGETWNVIACSITPDGKENTSSGVPAGPDVALAVLASAAPIYSAPQQPGSFTAELVEVGYNEDAQMPVAHLRVTIPQWGTTATTVRVYQSTGSVPSDPASWGTSIVDSAVSSGSDTVIDWWTPQSFSAALTVYLRVRASSSTYLTTVVDDGPSDKSVVIPQVGAPDQPANFVVTLHTDVRGGSTYGALEVTWTAPSDVKYFSANVYSIQCDSGYAPLTGAEWTLVGSAVAGFDQRYTVPPQWWPFSGEGWVKFKIQSVGRAKDPATGTYIENTASAPTQNIHVTASPGFDASYIDPNTIDANTLSIIDGKLTGLIAAQESLFTALNSTDFQVVSGQLQIKSIDLGKALGSSFNSAELRLNNGKLEVNGLDLAKVISSTITSELAVSGGKFGVASVSAAKITAGYLVSGVIYTGSLTASQIVTGTLGASVVYGGTIYGNQIWAQTLTGFTINSSTLNTVTINTGTITSGQIYGCTISLTLNGLTTIVNNSYDYGSFGYIGFKTSDGTNACAIAPTTFALYNSTRTIGMVLGTNPYIIISGGSSGATAMFVSSYPVLNFAGAFVGKGVLCPLDGIGGFGHNTYYSGVWRYGRTMSFYDRDSNLINVYGGIIGA